MGGKKKKSENKPIKEFIHREEDEIVEEEIQRDSRGGGMGDMMDRDTG